MDIISAVNLVRHGETVLPIHNLSPQRHCAPAPVTPYFAGNAGTLRMALPPQAP
jgi:hypothetical protein